MSQVSQGKSASTVRCGGQELYHFVGKWESWKFMPLQIGEIILKIGQDLTKLPPKQLKTLQLSF